MALTRFYKAWRELCEKKGVTERQAIADMGMSYTNVVRWREGMIPRRITLDKIEAYLGAKGFADAFDPHMRTSSFYDKWSSLCKKNKKDPKDVLKELGLAGVYDKRWKNGVAPQDKTLRKIAAYFNVPLETLYDDEEEYTVVGQPSPGNTDAYIADARERGGAKAARDVKELVTELRGMFAGGVLSEDAMDGVMKSISDAYWEAREKNKKYTPKKYRYNNEQDTE